MKQYIFELVIYEGSDEFWESLSDVSGCDEVLSNLRQDLNETGLHYEIKLKQFNDDKNYTNIV